MGVTSDPMPAMIGIATRGTGPSSGAAPAPASESFVSDPSCAPGPILSLFGDDETGFTRATQKRGTHVRRTSPKGHGNA